MLPKKRRPTHPGEVLFEEFLIPLKLSQKQFADSLGKNWSEQRLSLIIEGQEDISPKSAQEIASVLGTTSEFWTHLQNLCHEWDKIHKQNEKGSLKPWKKAG